jgi:hypothetical protein
VEGEVAATKLRIRPVRLGDFQSVIAFARAQLAAGDAVYEDRVSPRPAGGRILGRGDAFGTHGFRAIS